MICDLSPPPPPALEQTIFVAEIQEVVPHWVLATVAVAVASTKPKLTPNIVMVEPEEVGPFSDWLAVNTGESNVKSTAPRVATTLDIVIPTEYFAPVA